MAHPLYRLPEYPSGSQLVVSLYSCAKQEGKKSFPVVKHVLHPWFKIVAVMDVVVGLNKVYLVAISLG